MVVCLLVIPAKMPKSSARPASFSSIIRNFLNAFVIYYYICIPAIAPCSLCNPMQVKIDSIIRDLNQTRSEYYLRESKPHQQCINSVLPDVSVGRNLWICTIHGSRCKIYGFLVRAGIHGSRRNLCIALGSCLRIDRFFVPTFV